jgi:DNA-binding winged helix-turn-helix (wHTH) protein
LEIDLVLRRVRVGGRDVRLAAKPDGVLCVLAEQPGKLLSNREIVEAVWGERIGTGYVREAIQCLQQRLEKDSAHPRRIWTMPKSLIASLVENLIGNDIKVSRAVRLAVGEPSEHFML